MLPMPYRSIIKIHWVTVGLLLCAPVVALVAAANSYPGAGFAFGLVWFVPY